MKKIKLITVVSMVVTLLIMAIINFSSMFSGREDLQAGLSLCFIGTFVLFALICSLITREVVMRGVVISQADKPRLYLTLIISMACISVTFIAFGTLIIMK